MKKLQTPSRESSTPKYIGLTVLILFVFMLGWNIGVNHTYQNNGSATNTVTDSNGKAETVNMQIFWDAWNILNGKYVDQDKLVSQEMVYGAIRGMVAAIGDPYTAFMTPKENREFQEDLNGHLEGIGAEITLKNGMLTVVSPLKNSPAKNAGIQPEDVISEIEGESTQDMTLEEAVKKIRGTEGTSVALTIIRDGHDAPIKISIRRAAINVNSVDWKMIGKIAYIEINQFGTNTKAEFSKAINDILPQRPTGVILDLRFNGGGYLDGAVDIASEFLPKEKVVTIKKRNPEEDEVIYVNGQARMANLPLVVIINKGSASASEIVAGAIQDHKRGTIIGEQSFGKGTVQEVQNLIGGASLRVTIAKWYTPNDNNISETGITPDIVVERTAEDFEGSHDPQLDAALKYLKDL